MIFLHNRLLFRSFIQRNSFVLLRSYLEDQHRGVINHWLVSLCLSADRVNVCQRRYSFHYYIGRLWIKMRASDVMSLTFLSVGSWEWAAAPSASWQGHQTPNCLPGLDVGWKKHKGLIRGVVTSVHPSSWQWCHSKQTCPRSCTTMSQLPNKSLYSCHGGGKDQNCCLCQAKLDIDRVTL